jgi:hypothetical protein
MRRAKVVGLTLEDPDLRTRELRIIGKGGRIAGVQGEQELRFPIAG